MSDRTKLVRQVPLTQAAGPPRVSTTVRHLAYLGLLVAAGCGPTAERAAVRVPDVARGGAGALEAPVEPSLAGARCALQGHAFSLDVDSVELCALPSTLCFGRVPRNDFRGLTVGSLRVAGDLHALVTFAHAGFSATAVVDAKAFAVQPVHVELLDGYFVPSSPFDLASVNGESATVRVRADHTFRPSRPLEATLPCSRLGLDDAPGEEAMRRALDLPEARTSLVTAIDDADLRVTPTSTPVATLELGTTVEELEAAHGSVRVLVTTDRGWVVGWVDAGALAVPTGGSRRTRTPRLRMGTTTFGIRCPAPVRVLAYLANRRVHVATIEAGTVFDPDDAGAALTRLFDPAVGMPASIPREDLVGCIVTRPPP